MKVTKDFAKKLTIATVALMCLLSFAPAIAVAAIDVNPELPLNELIPEVAGSLDVIDPKLNEALAEKDDPEIMAISLDLDLLEQTLPLSEDPQIELLRARITEMQNRIASYLGGIEPAAGGLNGFTSEFGPAFLLNVPLENPNQISDN